MSHFCSAASHIQRRASKCLNAEEMEAETGPNNVHDGIYRANFMKVNLFERDVVNAGFSFAQLRENRGGAFSNGRVKLRGSCRR